MPEQPIIINLQGNVYDSARFEQSVRDAVRAARRLAPIQDSSRDRLNRALTALIERGELSDA